MVRGLHCVWNENEIAHNRAARQGSQSKSGNCSLLREARPAAKTAPQHVRLSPLFERCSTSAKVHTTRPRTRVFACRNSGIALPSHVTEGQGYGRTKTRRSEDCRY